MDELEISGKRYLSTRRAGREHGYHSDYMGQLIRGKKVVGEKVGRSWYINEESLLAYLNKIENTPTQPTTPVAQVQPEPVVAPAPTIEPVAAPAPAPVPQPIVEVAAPMYQQPMQQPVQYAQHAPQPAAYVYGAPTPAVPAPDETRIPIRAQAPAPIAAPAPAPSRIHHELMGGLRYAEDDAPPMPAVTRMPRAHEYAEYVSAAPQHPVRVAAPMGAVTREKSRFPFVSLAVIAVLAAGTAVFAANFVSAQMVARPGQAASVQYAIHW